MNKKPGFQFKMTSESLLFTVIGIVIVLFILFLPNIYKIVSDLKTGNLFKKTDNPIVNNDSQNNHEEENVEEPTGEMTLVCTKTTSEPEGNLTETYTFYYNNSKLENIKNEKNYDAISDEYLNYVYSEYAEFNKKNDTYGKADGFNYDATLESRTLKATFIYDLSQFNLDDLNFIDETLGTKLNDNDDQSLDLVKQEYITLGYTCR